MKKLKYIFLLLALSLNAFAQTEVGADRIKKGTGVFADTNNALSVAGMDANVVLTVRMATTTVLPGTWVYSNGASGVGATLTRAAAGALAAIDGITPVANDAVLIKDQVTQPHNGVYRVTTLGDGSTATVLTRTTNSDATAELDNQAVKPTLGTVNGPLLFRQQTDQPTVGSSNIVYSAISSLFHTQILLQDEGSGLGTTGTVSDIDFTGGGVTANRTGNKITVSIPGGGGSGLSPTGSDVGATAQDQVFTNAVQTPELKDASGIIAFDIDNRVLNTPIGIPNIDFSDVPTFLIGLKSNDISDGAGNTRINLSSGNVVIGNGATDVFVQGDNSLKINSGNTAYGSFAAGISKIGDTESNGNVTRIEVDDNNLTIGAFTPNGITSLGDVSGGFNNTKIIVDDINKVIELNSETTRINEVYYKMPSSNAAGQLNNDGAGNLSWVANNSQAGVARGYTSVTLANNTARTPSTTNDVEVYITITQAVLTFSSNTTTIEVDNSGGGTWTQIAKFEQINNTAVTNTFTTTLTFTVPPNSQYKWVQTAGATVTIQELIK